MYELCVCVCARACACMHDAYIGTYCIRAYTHTRTHALDRTQTSAKTHEPRIETSQTFGQVEHPQLN